MRLQFKNSKWCGCGLVSDSKIRKGVAAVQNIEKVGVRAVAVQNIAKLRCYCECGGRRKCALGSDDKREGIRKYSILQWSK